MAHVRHGPATTTFIISIIVVVFGFGYFLQAPDRVCETLRYPDGHDTPGIFDE